MANAKKLKSGNWRVLAYVGKHVTKSGYKSFTAPTKKEAERLAAAFTPPEPQGDTPNITVGQAIDNYIAMKDAVLSPSTIRAYKIVRHTMLQSLMEIAVFELTQSDVQQAVNQDAAAGKSPKTLRNAHGLLRAAIGMERPDFALHTTLPQKKKPDIKIPTKEEIDQLIAAADPELASAIQLAAVLGLRRSEICALEWDDIQNGILTVNKASVRDSENQWKIKAPKSYAGYRILTLPDILSKQFEKRGNGKIFSFKPDDISWHFSSLQRRCFGAVRYRFHDLRHYNASVMLALGIPNKYAMERMGHASDNMLKAVYQHTMQDKQKEIAEQLNRFFNAET